MRSSTDILYSGNPTPAELYKRLLMAVGRIIDRNGNPAKIITEVLQKDPVIVLGCLRTLQNHVPGQLVEDAKQYCCNAAFSSARAANTQITRWTEAETIAEETVEMLLIDDEHLERILRSTKDRFVHKVKTTGIQKHYYDTLYEFLDLPFITDADRIHLLLFQYKYMNHLWNLHDMYSYSEYKKEIYTINADVKEIVETALYNNNYAYLLKLTERFPLLSLNAISMTKEELLTNQLRFIPRKEVQALLFFTATMIERDEIDPADLVEWRDFTLGYINNNSQRHLTDYVESIYVCKFAKHFPEQMEQWMPENELTGIVSGNSRVLKTLNEEAFNTLIRKAPSKLVTLLHVLGSNNVYKWNEKQDYIGSVPLADMVTGDEMIRAMVKDGMSNEDILYCYFNSRLRSIYPLDRCLRVLRDNSRPSSNIRKQLSRYPIFGIVNGEKGEYKLLPYSYRSAESVFDEKRATISIKKEDKIQAGQEYYCIVDGIDRQGNLRSFNVLSDNKHKHFRITRDYQIITYPTINNKKLMYSVAGARQKLAVLLSLFVTRKMSPDDFRNRMQTLQPLRSDKAEWYSQEAVNEESDLQLFFLNAIFFAAYHVSLLRTVLDMIGSYGINPGIYRNGFRTSTDVFNRIKNYLNNNNEKLRNAEYKDCMKALSKTLPKTAWEEPVEFIWQSIQLNASSVYKQYKELVKYDLQPNEVHTIYTFTMLKYIVPIDEFFRDTYFGNELKIRRVYESRIQLYAIILDYRMVSDDTAEIIISHTYRESPITVYYNKAKESNGIQISDIQCGTLYPIKFQEYDKNKGTITVVVYENDDSLPAIKNRKSYKSYPNTINADNEEDEEEE